MGQAIKRERLNEILISIRLTVQIEYFNDLGLAGRLRPTTLQYPYEISEWNKEQTEYAALH